MTVADGYTERALRFARLTEAETLRRNQRKTPAQRVDSLLAALEEVRIRGWWPQTDRHAKEMRLLCSIREKLSRA